MIDRIIKVKDLETSRTEIETVDIRTIQDLTLAMMPLLNR